MAWDFKGKGVARDVHGAVKSMQHKSRKAKALGGVKGVRLGQFNGPSGIGLSKAKSPFVFKAVQRDEIVKGGCFVKSSLHNVESSKETKTVRNDGVSPPVVRSKRHRLGSSPMALTVSEVGKDMQYRDTFNDRTMVGDGESKLHEQENTNA